MLSNQSQQISQQLGIEIKHLLQSSDLVYRDAVTEDTLDVVKELNIEIEKWVVKLRERSISCYELEHLLESKKDVIHLVNLEALGLKEHELSMVKNEILRIIAKSVVNAYFNSLFKNQLRTKSNDLRKQIMF